MSDINKPTKEQFEDYVRIRNSGAVNMWDITYICDESYTGLTKDMCFYIMDNFTKLADEYGVII